MKGIIFSCTIHYKPVFRQAQSIDMWNLHTFFDKTSPDYTQDKGKEKQNRWGDMLVLRRVLVG